MDGSSRRLVIALGGALGCSLLVIAFLLGRVTAKPADAARLAESTPAAAIPAVTGVPTAPLSESASALLPIGGDDSAPSADVGWTPPAVLKAQGTEAPRAMAPTAPLSADHQAIAAYFAQIERIDDVGAGDPQAFAMSMLQSMTSGDFSGFDDLLSKARTQKQRLQSMETPRTCLEHHRLALALSADSVVMLERLKAALMKGDSAVLMTMATEGRTLEEQANQLKSMGESIKRSAGL